MVGQIQRIDYRAPYATAPDEGVVADLSPWLNKLAAYEDIAVDLDDETELRLVEFARACISMSHSRISRRYAHWQEADRAHDVYVPVGTTEFREKAVISQTRAIADTVLTYQMAALAGRNPMFQLSGENRQSRRAAAIMERLLHKHMRRGQGEFRIAQHLNDSIRYGFAPTQVIWDNRASTNRIINRNPYRSFPDPRVQWGDQERGQFVAFTDHASYNALVSSGLYPKLRQYPRLRLRDAATKFGWDGHRWVQEEGRGLNIDPLTHAARDTNTVARFALGDSRVVDELWVRFLGDEIGAPQAGAVWMTITILDESVVIGCRLNTYGQLFPNVFGALYHDAHKTFGQSLYDLLLPMHDIMTWLLRSRVDNVQAALNNLIFVNETQIMVPDLIDRNPFGIVRMLPGTNLREDLHIAAVPDVTRSHWNDIAALTDMSQRLSAASDAQQGMPTSDGIRSATEIQRLTQLGSQRLGVLARIISATSIRPMVRMQVSNLQDFLTGDLSLRMDKTPPDFLAQNVQDGYLDFSAADLAGDIDYLVVDGTLPVEPTRSPETWMNILQVAGQAGLGMELDLKEIALKGVEAMGVPDLDQFRISKDQLAQGMTPSQQLQMMEKMRGASVMPDEQLAREAERGNIAPMREVAR